MTAVFGSVDLDWGGERHRFRLGIGECITLEAKCDAGLEQIIRRLQSGDWRLADVRETLRLGLVGAGMAESKALAFIVRNVDQRPLMTNVQPAMEVIASVLLPFVERPLPGKAEAAKSGATGASTSPPSSAAPSSSD